MSAKILGVSFKSIILFLRMLGLTLQPFSVSDNGGMGDSFAIRPGDMLFDWAGMKICPKFHCAAGDALMK